MSLKDSFNDPFEPSALAKVLQNKESYDPETFQKILDEGANPSENMMGTILIAISTENVDALERMIKAGITFESTGNALLVYAAKKTNPEILKLLLENGADPTHNRNSAIKKITSDRNKKPNDPDILACIKILVKHGAHAGTKDGIVLKQAIANGHIDAIHFLLKQKVNLRERFGTIGHPLLISAKFNFPDIIDDLFEKSMVKENYCNESLKIAAHYNNQEALFRLLHYYTTYIPDEKLDVSFIAAKKGHLPLLKKLIQKGYKTDLSNDTILTSTIRRNDGKMLDFLLDQGAITPQKSFQRQIEIQAEYQCTFKNIFATNKAWRSRVKVIEKDLPPNVETLQDLRDMKPSGFLRLAYSNNVQKLVQIATNSPNDKLEIKDLLTQDLHGNTVLEILGSRNLLKQIATIDIWKTRLIELKKLCSELPPIYKKQIDFNYILTTDRQKRLKARRNPRKPF